MDHQNYPASQFSQTNVPDYQKMLQTSATQDPGTAAQTGWQSEVGTLTPSPVVQHPQPSVSPSMAHRHFHNFTREPWDGGGTGMKSGGRGQVYHPSKYGLVVEELYRHDVDSRQYSPAGFDIESYKYHTGTTGDGGGQTSPTNSPVLMRRLVNRAPVQHRRSFPDNANSHQHLDEYDGYGSGSTAGGSTSGYGSGGGNYDYHASIHSTPFWKSTEYPEGISTPKPRSILRNSQSHSQLQGAQERMKSQSVYPPHQELVQNQSSIKKTMGDLRQWQQQHQEELIHQHIETQALYEKQVAPLESLTGQTVIKEEDPAGWEPIRRAADSIIREKNVIIEKLRRRVLELEEDLEIRENRLQHTLLASDDKIDIVHQKIKELQHKNAALKSEMSEMCSKKNTEINSLEEHLGATEHEMQQLKSQLKMKEADLEALETKLAGKEREVEELGHRFHEMKASHQKLRQKLDSVEKYLADLPTTEENTENAQEIQCLKEENAKNRYQVEDLEQKLRQTRKQLTMQELQGKELDHKNAGLQEQVKGLEEELQRVRQKDVTAWNLLQCEHELNQTRQEKERLNIDLAKAKKLLEATHRRLRQLEMRLQTEITELRERLNQEEEAVGTLRQEVMDKEQEVEKMKRLARELGSQNQDLMEQNLILREQMVQFEQQATDDELCLQRRFVAELGLCFSELQSLVQICLQRARGEDPNMSVLLGIRDAVGDSSEEDKGAKPGLEKGQTIKQWLSKLGELRQEVDGLRATMCNQYAEDMGQNIQCATQ